MAAAERVGEPAQDARSAPSSRRAGPGRRPAPPRRRRARAGTRSPARTAPSAPGRPAEPAARATHSRKPSSTEMASRTRWTHRPIRTADRARHADLAGAAGRVERRPAARADELAHLGRLAAVAPAVSSGTRKPRSPAKPQHSAPGGTMTASAWARATASRSGSPPGFTSVQVGCSTAVPARRGGAATAAAPRAPRRSRSRRSRSVRPVSRSSAGTASPSVPAQGEASVTTGSASPRGRRHRASAVRAAARAPPAGGLARERHAAAQPRRVRG